MQGSETLSAVSPLLRHRPLRVLLIAAPGIMATVAILTATESNLALAAVLNVAAGVVISSILFLAVAMVAHQVADERVDLAQATEQTIWRSRAERFSVYNDESGLYTDWYFRLRLREEIERSRRYGLHFAVLLVKPSGLHQEAEVQAASAWFGERIRRHLRRSDLPAFLQDGSLGVLMPNTGRRAAVALRHRVVKELAPVEPRAGLACFPTDGEAVSGLLKAAAHATAEEPEDRRVAAPPTGSVATA